MDKWVENTIYVWKKGTGIRRITINHSCPCCGYATEKKTRYCSNCGKRLKED